MFGFKKRKQEKLRNNVEELCLHLIHRFEENQISSKMFYEGLYTNFTRLNNRQEAKALASAIVIYVVPETSRITPIHIACGFLGLSDEPSEKQDKYLVLSSLYAIKALEFNELEKKLSYEGFRLSNKEDLMKLIMMNTETCVKYGNGFTLPDIFLWFDGIYNLGTEDYASMTANITSDIFDNIALRSTKPSDASQNNSDLAERKPSSGKVPVAILYDENGDSVEFRLLGKVEYENEVYSILTPYYETREKYSNEPADVFIMKIVEDECGKEMMETVEDTQILEEVYGLFKAKHDEFEFRDS